MTSPVVNGTTAGLLRDVSRRLTHQLNNAANGVAVNLEVVRSRTARADADATAAAVAPFVERASEQLESLTRLQEMVRSLLQLTGDNVDESRLTRRLSETGDAFEVIFPGTDVPRALSADAENGTFVSLRNSPHGVILSVPRTSPSSE